MAQTHQLLNFEPWLKPPKNGPLSHGSNPHLTCRFSHAKHSKVKLTKIFDIFSGVNVKTQDLGLKQHATNAEMSQPTISLNNVMTLKIMPLKIAFIYFLFSSLSIFPPPFPGT